MSWRLWLVLGWLGTVPAMALTVGGGDIEATVTDGVVTELRNKLTGERLSGRAGDLCGWWRQQGPGSFTWQSGAAAAVDTSIRAVGDKLVVQQRVEGREPGLRGVQWGLTVPSSASILVPGHSGLQFVADGPLSAMDFQYPQGWECQFVLVATARGGFLIQATDVAQHYKRLSIRRRADCWELGFESQVTGPFNRATRVDSTAWWLRAYAGDWTRGAALYRAWASAAFAPTGLDEQRPSWVAQTQCVVTGGLDEAMLTALAKRVRPEQTVIYVPSWRRDGYDRNYPDYTPLPEIPAQVRRARAMGFHVMLHCNYFGCTPENPAYEQLRAYHVRRAWDGRLDYWDWQRSTPPIKFAYLNPAAKAWRQLLVDRLAEVVRVTGCDSLHLDQTLCIENDQNGLIDGLNMMQGNLALHRDLRERLPEVALSGEGLNEITYRYEAFAQRHLAGLNHADRQWDLETIGAAHPVSSAILRPYTAIYGYLGMASPLDADYYLAWQTGYERFGVLPTLMWPNAADLAGGAPLVAQVVREAQWFQSHQPRVSFDGYGADTRFAWRCADGATVQWRREGAGAVLVAGPTVLARRVSGVGEYTGAGTIDTALGYDEQRVFGLDPRANYAWRPESRDLQRPHVAAAPRGVVLSGSVAGPVGVLRLTEPATEVALPAVTQGVRCGVRLRDGRTVWEAGGSLTHTTGAVVQRRHDSLFVHPPWRAEGVAAAADPVAKGLGETLVEYLLRLPAAPATAFSAQVGLDKSAWDRPSDGVTFRVVARAGEVVVTATRHVRPGAMEPLVLDLAKLAGREMTLTLETSPGPAGDPTFDWALWTTPRVAPRGSRPVELAYVSGGPLRTVYSADGPATLAADGGRWRLTVPSPGTTYLLRGEPTAVQAGVRLAEVPFESALREDGGRYSAARSFMRAGRAEAAVGGRRRAGLSTHPPNNGQIEVYCPVRLPVEPLRLTGYCGLRDGHQSKGVGFRIRVGDRELWRTDLPAGASQWVPVAADLREFAGREVVLVLVADSLGDYGHDWAHWGDLVFER